MKDEIIEILKNNEIGYDDGYGGQIKVVTDDNYNDVADEIVKLLATIVFALRSCGIRCTKLSTCTDAK